MVFHINSLAPCPFAPLYPSLSLISSSESESCITCCTCCGGTGGGFLFGCCIKGGTVRTLGTTGVSGDTCLGLLVLGPPGVCIIPGVLTDPEAVAC